jgi:hypothetical protein
MKPMASPNDELTDQLQDLIAQAGPSRTLIFETKKNRWTIEVDDGTKIYAIAHDDDLLVAVKLASEWIRLDTRTRPTTA